jgi:hypothetical protein
MVTPATEAVTAPVGIRASQTSKGLNALSVVDPVDRRCIERPTVVVPEPDVTMTDKRGQDPSAGSTTRAMSPEADCEVDVTREYAAMGTRVGAGSA